MARDKLPGQASSSIMISGGRRSRLLFGREERASTAALLSAGFDDDMRGRATRHRGESEFVILNYDCQFYKS
jgi:hypothetical protein